jgi:hypothetical protein
VSAAERPVAYARPSHGGFRERRAVLPNRMRTSLVIAALAVSATLTACGSQSLTSTGAAGSPSPSTPAARSSPPGTPGTPSQGTGQNKPAVVRLAAGFSPRTVRLRAGQQFLVVVSPDVQASGVPSPGGCPAGTTRPVAGGLLTAQCLAGGRYLYTALRSGNATVVATVRPRCAPGSMCPQWITEPRLAVAIS